MAAEALALGAKAGLDPARMVEVLLSGSGRSEVLVSRAPRILRGDFRPSFQLKYAAKDMGLAVAMARLARAPVPLTTILHQLYQSAAAAGRRNRISAPSSSGWRARPAHRFGRGPEASFSGPGMEE